MRALLIAPLLVVLAACGQAPGTPGARPEPMPTAVPRVDGEVRTRGLVTVMDTGRPELCLGPVAESFPPQCRGLPLAGWDWKRVGRGVHETQGKVRWGQYAVTGTFDGTVFTVNDAVPAALYDPMVPDQPPALPPTGLAAAELEQIEREVHDLPGYLSSFVDEGGHVMADVVLDDGSLQDWADQEHGEGTVQVDSALVPAQ